MNEGEEPGELPDSGPPLPQEFITNLYFGWGYAVGGLIKAVANRPVWDALQGGSSAQSSVVTLH